jgi:putative FmdB family regulatory protein
VPIYDYTCSRCRRTTEVIHGIVDHGPKFCPECGAEGTMTKAFVAPTVHFKGTGWAKKDRGTSARAARAKDEKGSPTSDSKPAGAGSGSGTDGTKSDKAKSDGESSSGSSSRDSSSGSSSSDSSQGDSSPSSGSSD